MSVLEYFGGNGYFILRFRAFAFGFDYILQIMFPNMLDYDLIKGGVVKNKSWYLE